MSFKLRQLSHALAVWRHGSFRRAAEEQHLSQPALSRSIHSLETSLAVTLFDRQSGALKLTAYGESFLSRAEAILLQAAELEREMELMRSLSIGHLSVTMSAYAADMSGIRAATELLHEHNGLHLHLTVRPWRVVEHAVRNGQADLGFGEIAHLHDVPELRLEPVGGYELVFYCRPGHPLLASDTVVSTADLDAYPFAGVPAQAGVAQLFPRNCKVDPVTGDINPPIIVEDIRSACTIVAGTDAFGAATPLQLEPFLTSGQLAVVPFMAPWLRLDYGFIMLASRSVSPAAEAFMVLVREIECEAAQRNRVVADNLFRALKVRGLSDRRLALQAPV